MKKIHAPFIVRIFIMFWFAVPTIQIGFANVQPVNHVGLGGDFRLIDFNGKRFDLVNYRGKIVVLQFGYLTCPDICPITLLSVSRAVQKLLPNVRKDVVMMFVTLDPERDTTAKLKAYLRHFSSNILGLRGSDSETVAVAKKYGVAFYKTESKSKLGYFIAHTDAFYIIDELGTVINIHQSIDKPEKIAHSIQAAFDMKQVALDKKNIIDKNGKLWVKVNHYGIEGFLDISGHEFVNAIISKEKFVLFE